MTIRRAPSPRHLAPAALALLALLAPVAVHAQGTAPDSAATAAVDGALARAQRAAIDGNTASARRVLDSLVTAVDAASPRFPELLFWHATYAATAAEAERDYRRLVVEHPLSPRAEDALLRLAQLELARGDQALALRHLERLVLEHPTSAHRARASYWMGRAWLEQGDATKGCDALRGALAQARGEEVELRNQVAYAASGRCGRMDVAATGAGAGVQAASATPTATPAVATSAPATVAATPPGAGAPPASTMSPKPAATVTDSAPRGPTPLATRAATAPAAKPATKPAAPRYAVQVAAYESRAAADALAKRLVARGMPARVSGSEQPFRVRVGRWSREEAVKQAAAMKAKGIAGFVVAELEETP